MYNTKQIAEVIFDKLKNTTNLTQKEKDNKINEISELLIKEHNKALSLLDVSNCFKLGTDIEGNGFEAIVMGEPEIEYKMRIRYKHNGADDYVDYREWKCK